MSEFDGDYNDDPDYYDDDPDGAGRYVDDESSFESQAREIAANYGILDWSEVIVDFSNVDPSELRGDRFDTLEEAVVFLFDLGVLEFGGVVYYEDIDMYGVQIDSDTGTPAS